MDEVLEREDKWDVDEHFAVPRLDDLVAGGDVERSTVDARKRLLRHRRRRPAVPRRAAAATRRRRRHRLAAQGAGRRGTRRDPHRAVRHPAVGVDRRPHRHAAGQAAGQCGDDPHRRATATGSPTPSIIASAPRWPTTMSAHRSTIGCWRGARSRSSSGRTPPARATSAHQTAEQGRRQTRRAIRPSSPASRRTTRPEAAGGTAAGRAVAELRDRADRRHLRRRPRLAPRQDPIHDTRVAIRRLRSTMRVFGKLLDRSATGHVDDELKWFAGLLGEVRDCQVQRRRFQEALDAIAARARARTGRQPDQHRSAVRATAGAQGRRGGHGLAAVSRPAGDAAAVAHRAAADRAADPQDG